MIKMIWKAAKKEKERKGKERKGLVLSCLVLSFHFLSFSTPCALPSTKEVFSIPAPLCFSFLFSSPSLSLFFANVNTSSFYSFYSSYLLSMSLFVAACPPACYCLFLPLFVCLLFPRLSLCLLVGLWYC